MSSANATLLRVGSFNRDVTVTETVKAYGAGKPDRTDLQLTGPAAIGHTIGEPTLIGRNPWRYPISSLTSGPLPVRLPSAADSIQDLFDNNRAE